MSLDKLERKIGLTLANRNLLTEAFTHGSIRGKTQSKNTETYRRLEFLGDAVLRLAVSESVFRDSDGNVEKLHDTREKFISNHSGPPPASASADPTPMAHAQHNRENPEPNNRMTSFRKAV